MKNLFAFLVFASLFGCGDLDDNEGNGTSTEVPTDSASQSDPSNSDDISFSGYVLNVFEVTVDGVEYADLEDFYTHELARLPQKAEEAGYDESYTISLEAAIGFKDLWTGMDVYVSPMGKTGYQGFSQVGGDGKFSVKLPEDARDDSYRVRATKRIRVKATKGEDVTYICYNFSAMEKSVSFSASSKPIILDAFTSSITAYDCAPSTGDGLTIPDNGDSSQSGNGSGVLQLGMSKSEVLGVLGRESLIVESSQKWCWTYSYNEAERSVCAVQYGGFCSCSVTFDTAGQLVEQDNIRSDLLDVLNW